jgi:hypothetical protein
VRRQALEHRCRQSRQKAPIAGIIDIIAVFVLFSALSSGVKIEPGRHEYQVTPGAAQIRPTLVLGKELCMDITAHRAV